MGLKIGNFGHLKIGKISNQNECLFDIATLEMAFPFHFIEHDLRLSKYR